MDSCAFTLSGETLRARASGALWWPAARLLCVSDLHLCKAERVARRAGCMLPPYETRDTLARLDAEIAALDPACVVCLGDSFDDGVAATAMDDDTRDWLARLQHGRRWIWIEGNHDPFPCAPGGIHCADLEAAPLIFRHIARSGETGEISGHFHPKATLTVRGRRISRPCFLRDADRVVLPAFGTYTGGLSWLDPALSGLMAPGAMAILTGAMTLAVPMPRRVGA